MQQQSILEAFHAAIRILIQSKVIFFFAESPITQQSKAASTLHPVWLLRSHHTSQHYFLPLSEKNIGLGNWKNVFLLFGFVSERKDAEKERRKKNTHTTET